MRKETSIFFRGSRTFFVSSLFFPRRQRSDVFKLYSFLRSVDDYVDQPKPDQSRFNEIITIWSQAQSSEFDTTIHESDSTDLRVIKNILNLTKKYDFDPAWIEAFFNSMEADINGKKYKIIDETLEYVYGSAEVVGLMMARIMRLPPDADNAARLQGRAFQWINFIRDIEEDSQLGRQYFPADDLKRFNLKDMSQKTAQTQPEDFKNFIQFQIDRYKQWQLEAEKGYAYIPYRTRKAITTAARSYKWTANQIFKTPELVFWCEVKPPIYRIIWNFIKI